MHSAEPIMRLKSALRAYDIDYAALLLAKIDWKRLVWFIVLDTIVEFIVYLFAGYRNTEANTAGD